MVAGPCYFVTMATQNSETEATSTTSSKPKPKGKPKGPEYVWVACHTGGPYVAFHNAPEKSPSGKSTKLVTRKVVLVPGINRVDADAWEKVCPPGRLDRVPGAQPTGLERRLEDGTIQVLDKGWEGERPRRLAELVKKSSNAKLLRELAQDEDRPELAKALAEQLGRIDERWDPIDATLARHAHTPAT